MKKEINKWHVSTAPEQESEDWWRAEKLINGFKLFETEEKAKVFAQKIANQCDAIMEVYHVDSGDCLILKPEGSQHD